MKDKWYDSQDPRSGITRRLVTGATAKHQLSERLTDDLPHMVDAAMATFDGASLIITVQIHGKQPDDCPEVETIIAELDEVDLRDINRILAENKLPRLEPHHILYLLSGIWTPDVPLWDEEDAE